MLDSIGTGQTTQQLQDKTTKLVKEYSEKMDNDVGIQPYLSEEGVREYLEEVMKEFERQRAPK
jgi:hypothetical protein